MAPTLQAGDVVWVWQLAQPGIGDVVLVREPGDEGRRHLKRLVAVGGQEVELSQGRLYVDGRGLAVHDSGTVRPWLDTDCDARTGDAVRERAGERAWEVLLGGSHLREKIPDGGVWLLGDNRGASSDSRHWGPVEETALVGVASGVLWSRDPCGGLRLDRIGHLAEDLRGTGHEPPR
jgi:signal peptidase I